MSRLFPNVVHRVLWRTQRGVCAGCGKALRLMECSVDHVVPMSLKGAESFGNLVVMHGLCNSRKSNRLPNGCELIWLLAVNARLGVGPQTMRTAA